MRLGLDIDDVVCDFTRGVFEEAGIPIERVSEVRSYDYNEVLDFKPIWERVKDSQEFWLSLAVLDRHIPACCVAYVTARYCPPAITETWLIKNGLPLLPIYHAKGTEKLEALYAHNLDGIVDDKAGVFMRVYKELPTSFLVSRPWNRHVVTPNRIYRLEELEWRVPH